MLNPAPQNNYTKWLAGWYTGAPTTYQGCDQLAFQRWFKFKEAFSPLLVGEIIEMLPVAPKHILDCFAGSGTTGLVSQFMQIPSTLIEVNPFLAEIIATKIEDYTGVEFHQEYRIFKASYKAIDVNIEALRKRLPPTFIEPGVKERWLFNEDVALELEKVRLAIASLTNPKVARFFKVALASCLVSVSNAFIDGKGRRYRKNWNQRIITASDVYSRFDGALHDMVRDVCRHDTIYQTPCNVLNCDARQGIHLIEKQVDLAIFSPPYPNSFDYTDIYNIELWFLEYFSCAEDNTSLRLKTLRSHVQARWEKPSLQIGGQRLRETVEALVARRQELWNKNIPEMVAAYFEDMGTILAQIQAKLAPEGKIAIVVGDSAYAGVSIDTATILENIAFSLGLKLELKRTERVMRSSVQNKQTKGFLNEWLLIFGTS